MKLVLSSNYCQLNQYKANFRQEILNEGGEIFVQGHLIVLIHFLQIRFQIVLSIQEYLVLVRILKRATDYLIKIGILSCEYF